MMHSALTKACRHALKHNLAVKPGESVLIVTDESKRSIGQAFEHAALELTQHVELVEIPLLKSNGQEPPNFVAEKMKQADVVLMPLAKSLSWTRARLTATESGARIASMPRITEAIILRTFAIDYSSIKRRVNLLCDHLDAANSVRITTQRGTDLEIGIAARKAHGRKGGMYTQKGHWGNLPCGEAFIAPLAGTSAGTYVVDASQAGVGKLTEPIKITVKDGLAVDINGGPAGERLANMLAAVGDADVYHLAEFGIGCNDQATICGITLEDEKVLGTCHIALGNNVFFGGTVEVGVHVDGVIKEPTIFFDEQRIMEYGKLLLQGVYH